VPVFGCLLFGEDLCIVIFTCIFSILILFFICIFIFSFYIFIFMLHISNLVCYGCYDSMFIFSTCTCFLCVARVEGFPLFLQ